MWTKLKPLLFLLSIGLNIAFVGVWAYHQFASEPAFHRHSGEPETCEECPLHQLLETSESQRQAIEPLQARFRDSSQMLCGQLCRQRAELIDLIAADSADFVAIHSKQDEIFSRQRRMEDLVVEQLLAEKRLLSPDQREKLFGMIRSRCNCLEHRSAGLHSVRNQPRLQP
ncbi:MAG: Spy/CpxP family protein refolding chaperone [Calditrichota bacterium]